MSRFGTRFPTSKQADVDTEANLELLDVDFGCTTCPGAKGSALSTALRDSEHTIRSLHSANRATVACILECELHAETSQ